jgi:predicted nucleotidyltransferase
MFALPVAQILRVARDHGALDIRLFGSHARGEAGARSDVDLLVRLAEGRTLLDLVGMKQALEELLGVRVDVVTEAALSPYLRARILAEAKPLAA